MEMWLNFIVSVLSGLAVCIPLVVKLVVAVKDVIKEKNWSELCKIAMQFMISAEGNFANGVFSGQGTFTAKSGWSYTGEFKNGKPDGQGTLKAKDGKVYKGTFKQGIYQK